MFYRKYRSQKISEIDNSEIREGLGKALLDNNFSSAYLLIGTRGSGKTSMARLIAKIVNCTDRKKGEEPCNKCDSCLEISEGRSLDVIEIDAASNTGVDDIRDLREKVKLAPAHSKFKVYIIDEVHMLSTSAFNALLKTLEEPPKHVIFVLATTDVQKVPSTIVSRCMVYDFKTAMKEDILHSLSRVVAGEKLEIDKEALELVSDLARGSFRDAQKILEQLALSNKKILASHVQILAGSGSEDVSRDLLEAIDKNDSAAVLELVEKHFTNNGKIEALLEGLFSELRNYLLFKNGIGDYPNKLSFSVEEIADLQKVLIEAGRLGRDCPVPQLPLESAVLQFISQRSGAKDLPKEEKAVKKLGVEPESEKIEGMAEPIEKNTDEPGASSVEEVVAKWPELLNALKPYNHSLVAFLRACRPKEFKGGYLVIDVFYKFHRDKLSEEKNRATFEKVISDIMGTKLKAKFQLSEKEGR